MKKKTISMLLVSTMVLTLLAGCGSSATESADSATKEEAKTTTEESAAATATDTNGGEKVKLRILHSYNGLDETALAEFRELHPEIEIESTYVASEQYNAKFSALSAADEIPDVFWTQSSFFVDQVKNGLLENLDDELKEQNYEEDEVWEDTFVPELLENSRSLLGSLGEEYTSHTYAVPYTMTSIAIVYDKNLFDSLGLEAPSTWDEFVTVNNTLKENGYIPMSMLQGWMDWYPRLFWDQYCRTELEANPKAFEDGTMTFSSDSVKEGLVKFKEMWDNGWFPESGPTDARETAQQLFVQKKVAQFFCVPSGLTYLSENVGEDVQLASYAFPSIGEYSPRSLGGAGTLFGISATSEQKEAALLFIKFLTSKTNFSQDYAKYLNAGLTNTGTNDNPDLVRKGYTDAANGGFSPDIFVPINITPDITDAALSDLLPNYLLGVYDLDYVCEELQRIYEESYLNKTN